MILAEEGDFQDVRSHDNDASDFSNVLRSSITSRLDPECTTVLKKKKFKKKMTPKKERKN